MLFTLLLSYHPIFLYASKSEVCIIFQWEALSPCLLTGVVLTLNSVTLLQKVMLRVQSSVCWLSQVWSTCSALCHVLCCIIINIKSCLNNQYAIFNIAVTVSLTMYPMFQEWVLSRLMAGSQSWPWVPWTHWNSQSVAITTLKSMMSWWLVG